MQNKQRTIALTLTILSFMAFLLLWSFFIGLSLGFNWPNIFSMFLMSILLWVVSPWMNEIKQNYPLGITKESVDWTLFASLHGVYQLCYLLVIIMLIFIILKSAKRLHVLGYQ